MPIPSRRKGQAKDDFLTKCIADLSGEYPPKQAAAICYLQMAKEEDNSQYVYSKQLFNKTTMNREQLKELVKAHFNLVDVPSKETFGEVYDENKAFKIVFPGEELKVGDKVKVVTTDGQEMDAPDGYHKLEDGKVIKTEGSVVTEIAEYEAEEKEEEMAEGEGDAERKAQEEIEAMFAADPAISQVEGTTAQNASTDVNPDVEADIKTEADVQAEEMMKKIKMAVDEEVASAITGIKEEMAKMKEKLEAIAAAPAKEKVTMGAGSTKTEKFSTASNDKQANIMRELLKNKK